MPIVMDPLATIGIFFLGASAGALVTAVRWRTILTRWRNIGESSLSPIPEPGYSMANRRMKGLVLSSDIETIGIVSHLFQELRIETHSSSPDSEAIERLRSEKFEALVLDLDDAPRRLETIRSLQEIRPNRDITVFAVASSEQARTAALDLGTVFIVEKPIVAEQMRSLLRTVYGRLLRSAQTYFRLNIELPVSVARNAGTPLQCRTINLSQTGMAVTTPSTLDPGERLHIVFVIPHTDTVVSAEGTVIWDDSHEEAGIRFDSLCKSAHGLFVQWLRDQFFKQLDSRDVNSSIPGEQVESVAR